MEKFTLSVLCWRAAALLALAFGLVGVVIPGVPLLLLAVAVSIWRRPDE